MRMGYYSYSPSVGFTMGGIGLGGGKVLGRDAKMSAGDFSVQLTAKRSCSEIMQDDTSKSLKSGLYPIDPDGDGGVAPFLAYCDMSTAGGGWTLVSNRKDDAPVQLTKGTLRPTDEGKAIDDKRFRALKSHATGKFLL